MEVLKQEAMRTRKYISPSSLALFYKNPEEYYTRYLSPNRVPDMPQNQPMAIGSSFDAYVKSYLHEALFGKGKDPKYEFEALFEAQVESHQRDWAREHGKYCFEQYKSAGCIADLMTELKQARGEPRFEFDLLGAVEGEKEPVSKTLASVPFLGKPDCHFINAMGASVILDFKVNGYCSKWPCTPTQGYLRMRSAGKFNHGQHKKCHPMMYNGMLINIATKLDSLNPDWAAQLSIYAWLLGDPVGSEFIVGIDQLACNAVKSNPPEIRIAEHRSLVDADFQRRLFAKAAHCWEVTTSDHIFRDMSFEDSRARCIALDQVAAGMLSASGGDDAWFTAITRGGA